MALHLNFPRQPYTILKPDQRWFPADDVLRNTTYEKLLPPLVAETREGVSEWRVSGYPSISATSKVLLNYWFEHDHQLEQVDGTLTPFHYYFAQRGTVETIIWLYDACQAHDKFDLMRFDTSMRLIMSIVGAWPGLSPSRTFTM
jgi:type III restriction enzyme